MSEDPKKLASAPVPTATNTEGKVSHLEFSNDCRHIVVVIDKSIFIFSSPKLELVVSVEGAHGVTIDDLIVPIVGTYFVTTCGEEHPRVWQFPAAS
mmetsp:Transcript_1791/g.2119  ORF Transcript_1791/g.2119 Transcript_1791/m.2119 type:complete len:96 (-) Transcript_1791:116-403(-)